MDQFYAVREATLVHLAETSFDSALTAAERKVLYDSVRPGPPPKPEANASGQVAMTMRTVRGSFLRWIAVNLEASALLDPDGLQITYAIITGEVDLYAVRMSYSVNFITCILQGTLILQSASVQNLTIIDCEIKSGLRAADLTTTGGLLIGNTSCAGPLNFAGCRIGKQLRFIYSDISALKDGVLDLGQAYIGGDLRLESLNCARELSALDVTIAGSIILKGANLSFMGDAIHLDGATIGAELFLDPLNDPRTGKAQPFQCAGNFCAPHIRIGEDIHASNAIFNRADGVIDFSAAQIRNGELNFDGAHVSGELLIAAAKIGQGLSISNATFYQKEGSAITLDASEIGEDVDFDSLQTSATVLVIRTVIKAGFSCKGAKLQNLLIVQAVVGSDLVADEATFYGNMKCLDTQIDGQLSLRKMTCAGPVDLERGRIRGDLRLDGARVNVREGIAVALNSVEIGGGLILSRGFVAGGSVQMSYSNVGKNVSCVGASIDSLQITNTKVAGWLYWLGIRNAHATGLNLSDSSIARIYDDRDSWPSRNKLNANGLRYQELILCRIPSKEEIAEVRIPEAASQTANDRIEWLQLQDSRLVTTSQPWQQLAAFFDDQGDGVSAKHVRYMMGRVQGYSHGTVLRILNWPYDVIQENPLRITVPIGSLWVIGTLVFWRARRMRAMAPTDKEAYKLFIQNQPIPGYLPFQPAIYALEQVLPVVKFGQENAWGPNPGFTHAGWKVGWRRCIPRMGYHWLALLRWMLILLGWMLALILAGAIGSRFKA